MLSEPSPGERLAARLRRSPIYVDPSLESALPAAEQRRLIAEFQKAPAPIFVVLVPLVAGGTWSDAEELATVVRDRLGRDGIYITFGDRSDDLMAREWGGEYQARDAAWAVTLDRGMKEASLSEKLSRIIHLIVSGTGTREYKRVSAEISERVRKSPGYPGAPGEDGLALPLGAAGAAAAGLAALLLWRRRRMASAARRDVEGEGVLMPRTVFETASRANEDQLREQASREVIHFGELLDETSTPTNEQAGTLMARALDAYQAAGKTLDAARGIPDLAGVLVLVDQGRDALASAQAVAKGKPEIPPMPLCFFNPLHGDATAKLDWRPLGSRERLRVQACPTCARATRAKRTPEVLMDTRDGRPVPYYEADPKKSIWAETGYGQLREDLIHRVLRGDLNNPR